MKTALYLSPLALCAGLTVHPVLAQEMDHSGHSMHAGHVMPEAPAMSQAAPPEPDVPADHSAMGHSGMDHSDMDHSGMDLAQPAALSEGSPPAVAGSGPPRAADAVWGADAMRASRAALGPAMGGQKLSMLMADRLEYRTGKGADGYLWDVTAWYGGDINKLWLRSEGEGAFGESPEKAQVEALWSHAIGPWFDMQAGLRQDLSGPERTYATLAVQGLAPYQFDVRAAAYLSAEGDLTARLEAEVDQRITQRLFLQPRAEIALAAQDVPELGIGSGVSSLEAGLRLRYHVSQEIAPYIGVSYERLTGGSADYARASGDKADHTRFVAGLRLWF